MTDATDDASQSDVERAEERDRGFERYRAIGDWFLTHWMAVVNALVLVASGFVVLWVLHPDLLLTNTTTAGGDTGAHVWWPAFLRDNLLPSGRLAGWSKDYYAGFPAGQFYFPIPALMIVLLDVVLPYNVAFKLVTASGAVLLPAAAFVFGRGLRIRFPGPAFMGASTLALLFFAGDPRAALKVVDGLNVENAAFNQRIMGGTLASTLAGEFSFTIALCFALCFLGVFAATLRGGKRPGWAALLLAATVLSHIVVGIFVAVAALVVLSFRLLRDERRMEGAVAGAAVLLAVAVAVFTISVWWTLPFALLALAAIVWFALGDRDRMLVIAVGVGGVGAFLTCVWTLPLVARFPYTSNMRYEKLVDLASTSRNEIIELYLFPNYGWRGLFPWVFGLGVIAVATAIAVGRRGTGLIVVITGLMGILFWRWPEAHAWNLRFLPFWYLGWFLLAGIGVAELARAPEAFFAWQARREERIVRAALAVGGAGDAVGASPAPIGSADSSGELRTVGRIYTAVLAVIIGVFLVPLTAYEQKSFLPFWAEYNYTGYEWVASKSDPVVDPATRGPCNIPAHSGGADRARSAKAYPEFQSIMQTMGALPPGRALWEPSSAIDKYGTTLALELLPYCTRGRISSMEGLYFEAAGTTAYHFITVSELAQQPSNPMRFPAEWSAYGTLENFDRGVRHLQDMGVRYYMAQSDQAKAKADANANLEFVVEIPDLDGIAPKGWKVYEVRNAPVVQGLRYEPVVVTGQSPSDWQQSEPGSRWLVDWFNDATALDRPLAASGPKQWARVAKASAKDAPFGEPLPAVEISNVRQTQGSVAFDVSQIGVPVLVKTSYYPSWKARGAQGPYRVSPNFMVVVPTATHVDLAVERTAVDWLGILATLVGVAGTVFLFRWTPPVAREPRSWYEPVDRDGATAEPDAHAADETETTGDAEADAAPADTARSFGDAGTGSEPAS